MSKKNLVLLSIIALVGAFAAATYFYRDYQAKKLEFIANKDFKTFVRDHSPRYGNPDAKVYLIEFLDPECEACRLMAPYVKDIVDRHEGKVQLVVRYAPFHGNSRFAAQILEASRKQEKYWDTLELLFKYQPEWGSHHNPQPEKIWGYLEELDLDIDYIKNTMNSPGIAALIDQDVADLKKLEVRRTPTFFVNGRPLEKFGPDHLAKLVAEVLAEVEQK